MCLADVALIEPTMLSCRGLAGACDPLAGGPYGSLDPLGED